VTHQPLHSASFGTVVWSTPHVWLLSGWPWLAVPSLAFIVVLLVLAGHWAGGSLNDGLAGAFGVFALHQMRDAAEM
jgi:hypothetical protein